MTPENTFINRGTQVFGNNKVWNNENVEIGDDNEDKNDENVEYVYKNAHDDAKHAYSMSEDDHH